MLNQRLGRCLDLPNSLNLPLAWAADSRVLCVCACGVAGVLNALELDAASLLLQDVLGGEDLRDLLGDVMDEQGRVRVEALIELALEEDPEDEAFDEEEEERKRAEEERKRAEAEEERKRVEAEGTSLSRTT